MSKVTRSTSGSTTIADVDSYVDVTISSSYDLTKTILFFQISSPSQSGYHEAAVVSGQLFSSCTKYARFERASTGVYNVITINYYIVELTTATVQRGSKTMSSSDTEDISITAIDSSKTFVIATSRCNTLSSTTINFCILANLTSTTNLRIQRGSATGNCYVEWQVITLSDVNSIQVLNGTVSSSSTDISITSVTTSKTFIVPTLFTTADQTNAKLKAIYLTSATNVRIESTTTSAWNYNIFVVEMKYDLVYAGQTSIAASSSSTTPNIGGTVVVANCVALMGNSNLTWGFGTSTAQNAGEVCNRVSAITTTTLTITRGATTNGVKCIWQIIEFKDAPKGYPVLNRRIESMDLKQSTAIELEIGPFIAESDFTTRQTGLSLSFATHFRIKKNGGTLAAPTGSGSITHSFQGNYKFTFATGDLDTLGTLELFVDISGSTQCQRVYNVITAAEWDRKYGSTLMQVNVTQLDGNTLTSGNWALSGKKLWLSNSDDVALKAVSTHATSPGMYVQGNTTGQGLLAEGGASGIGIEAKSGSSGAEGIKAWSQGGHYNGISAIGYGGGNGIYGEGGSSGSGIKGYGGSSNGSGIVGVGSTGSGIYAVSIASGYPALDCTSTNGDGIRVIGNSSYKDINAKELTELMSEIDSIVSKLPSTSQLMSGATDLAAVKTEVDKIQSTILPDLNTIDINIDTIISKLPSTGQLMAGATDLSTIDSNIDSILLDLNTISLDLNTIDTNIDTIISKLPSTGQLMAGATDLATVNTNILSIQNNTNFVSSIPPQIIIPSGSNILWIPITVQIRDQTGIMDDPDDNEVTVQIRSDTTLDNWELLYTNNIDNILSTESTTFTPEYFQMTRLSTGFYEIWMKINSSYELGSHTFTFKYKEDTIIQPFTRNFTCVEGLAQIDVELSDSTNNREIIAKSLKTEDMGNISYVQDSIYDGFVDTVETSTSVIMSHLHDIIAKLPSGTISDISLDTTIEGITLRHILSLVMAMTDGNYIINTSTGDMTIYKRDNVTPLTKVNATDISRTRKSV